MTPASRDPRVVAYGVVAVALVGVALATGEPVLAAGAAPFVVVLMMALRDLQPRDIDVSVAASSLTPLEGDDVTLTITVPRQPGVSTHVELELGPSWDAEDRDQLHLMAPPDGTDAVLTAVAQPRWWGRTSVGAVLVTHRDPEGLVLWEQRTTVDAAFRVLPPPTKVRELLPPPMSHALIGVHSSRLVGDGFDFAELRPYQDGDRLRDINWAATARYGEPHVNRRHPERNGDVVLVLDTYTDAMGGHSEVLQAVIAAPPVPHGPSAGCISRHTTGWGWSPAAGSVAPCPSVVVTAPATGCWRRCWTSAAASPMAAPRGCRPGACASRRRHS